MDICVQCTLTQFSNGHLCTVYLITDLESSLSALNSLKYSHIQLNLNSKRIFHIRPLYIFTTESCVIRRLYIFTTGSCVIKRCTALSSFYLIYF